MVRTAADQAVRDVDLVPGFTGEAKPPAEVSHQAPAAITAVDPRSTVTMHLTKLTEQ
jgi:hypothetical protein